MKLHFNDGWYFTESYSAELPGWTKEQVKTLTPIRIPHTVKELPLNYLNEQDYQMVSGYLHPLTVPADWAGRRVFLHFGAAAHEATVYCNGREILRHCCGYTAFIAELTEHLHFGGENMVCVRLDSRESLDQPPFGNVIDYLTYGGIYRAVTLEVTGQSRISDLFLHATHAGNAPCRSPWSIPVRSVWLESSAPRTEGFSADSTAAQAIGTTKSPFPIPLSGALRPRTSAPSPSVSWRASGLWRKSPPALASAPSISGRTDCT